MEVIAFVGATGTGKSHRALLVALENKADTIIDDGLLIQGSRIIAGISAKRQTSKVGAIKTALFTSTDHVLEVKIALAQIKPNRVLVLGTSTEMVDAITKRLEIPLPSLYIKIDEIASQKEITRARYIREQFGKHVIPAPTVEVKPRFSGTLIEPMEAWFRKRALCGNPSLQKVFIEQSVVRPSFTYLGKFFITNNVLSSIVSYTGSSVKGIYKVNRVNISNDPSGLLIIIEVSVDYGIFIPETAKSIQKDVIHHIEHMTSLHIARVDIHVKHMHLGS
jgi:uncharacterized alkaline shock family protein YloU